MQSGQPERIEYEYKRHGTLCLIDNWHVVTGQMIAPTIGTTRTEDDFVPHVHNLIRTNPEAGWVLVMDNLNVHCSASLVDYTPGHCARKFHVEARVKGPLVKLYRLFQSDICTTVSVDLYRPSGEGTVPTTPLHLAGRLGKDTRS